jgi:hypothetical protein
MSSFGVDEGKIYLSSPITGDRTLITIAIPANATPVTVSESLPMAIPILLLEGESIKIVITRAQNTIKGAISGYQLVQT